MNNIYLIAPLVGLLIFGGVYSKYARAHAAHAAEAQRLEIATRVAKKSAEDAAKASALEMARVTQIKRSEERAEKTREEELQKQARRTLEEERASAVIEVGRLRPQVAVLRRELEAMEATVARGEERTRQLQLQERYVHERAQQATASRAGLERLLERLETFEPRAAASPGSNAPQRTRG